MVIDFRRYEGHTKGPWTDRDDPEDNIYGLDEKGNIDFDHVIVCTDSGYYGPKGADRRLIIDAPILMQEFKNMVDAYTDLAEKYTELLEKYNIFSEKYLDKC